MSSSFFLFLQSRAAKGTASRGTRAGKLAVSIVTPKSAFFLEFASSVRAQNQKQRITVDEVEAIITRVNLVFRELELKVFLIGETVDCKHPLVNCLMSYFH